MERETYFKGMNERGPSLSPSGRVETKPMDQKEIRGLEGNGSSLLSPLFIELAHRIKNTLSSIKNITQLSRGKFRDLEFEDYFNRSVTEDIEKIESVINGLLNYVKVSTPMIKSNTIHGLLEEISDKYRQQLQDKRIRLFKKFEREIPETVVHEEQLRYIFSSILQYAIASIPPSGSIGILTKLFDHPKAPVDKKGFFQKNGRYVEIMIGFTGYKKPVVSLESTFRNSPLHSDEAMDLILRLVKEIVQKNRGIMKFDVDEKKTRTFISLVFPVERRKIVYYPKSNS